MGQVIVKKECVSGASPGGHISDPQFAREAVEWLDKMIRG